jgi:hypothetical protein
MNDRLLGSERRASVFLSHTARDKPFARQLAHDLRSSGATVWLDEAELLLGDSLIEKIGSAISAVDYLAVILSPASVASAWVQKEVQLSMTQEVHGRRVKVLPLLYEKCDVPPFLQDKLYADLTEPRLYGVGLAMLLSRLGLSGLGVNAGKLLVYDVGGGTLDCSVISIHPSYCGQVDIEQLAEDLRTVGRRHANEIDARRNRNEGSEDGEN